MSDDLELHGDGWSGWVDYEAPVIGEGQTRVAWGAAGDEGVDGRWVICPMAESYLT